MFSSLLKIYLQVFLFSSEIVVKMAPYVLQFLLFYHDHMSHVTHVCLLKSMGNVTVGIWCSLSTAAAGKHVKGEPSVCALWGGTYFFCA